LRVHCTTGLVRSTCVDKAFKVLTGLKLTQHDLLFFIIVITVEGRCDSLPCPLMNKLRSSRVLFVLNDFKECIYMPEHSKAMILYTTLCAH